MQFLNIFSKILIIPLAKITTPNINKTAAAENLITNKRTLKFVIPS